VLVASTLHLNMFVLKCTLNMVFFSRCVLIALSVGFTSTRFVCGIYSLLTSFQRALTVLVVRGCINQSINIFNVLGGNWDTKDKNFS